MICLTEARSAGLTRKPILTGRSRKLAFISIIQTKIAHGAAALQLKVEPVMSIRRKYKSDAFEAIHSAVASMHRAGTVDKPTVSRFDKLCLSAPLSTAPEQIDHARETD
jgi:hypothetical protein